MLNWKEVLAWKFDDAPQSYTARDAMLYALGLGYGQDPMDEDALRYVYEAHEKGQAVVPSLAVVLGGPGAWMRDARTGIDWVRSLHGEQGLIMHAPLPAEAHVIGRNRVTDIIDKGPGKGALLLMERDIVDAATGKLLATRTSSSFLRGDGGCGAPPRDQVKPEAMPTRAPDLVQRLAIRPEAALLYRLSGDYNPVHASPAIARKAGFERPILHGLCTFGMACRALLATVCGNDAARLRSMGGRFSAPVYPGDTLAVQVWDEPGGSIRFRVRVEERDITAFDFGQARLAA